MRKYISLILILLLVMSSIAAAEGKLTVTAKNLLEFDGDDTGYFFAKVENTGDAPIGLGNGKLVAFSANDDILISSEYISSYPNYILLEPGENAFVREFIWEQTLVDNDIVDYKFSASPYKYVTKTSTVPCEVYGELDSDYSNYVYVTFTNTTDEIKYGFYTTIALWDTEGNLIFVNGDSADTTGVYPGSTITRKVYVDSDCIKHFKAHGIEIANIEATVRYEAE